MLSCWLTAVVLAVLLLSHRLVAVVLPCCCRGALPLLRRIAGVLSLSCCCLACVVAAMLCHCWHHCRSALPLSCCLAPGVLSPCYLRAVGAVALPCRHRAGLPLSGWLTIFMLPQSRGLAVVAHAASPCGLLCQRGTALRHLWVLLMPGVGPFWGLLLAVRVGAVLWAGRDCPFGRAGALLVGGGWPGPSRSGWCLCVAALALMSELARRAASGVCTGGFMRAPPPF